MTLRIYDGKLLLVSGQLATSEDCCCGDEPPPTCCDSVVPFSVDVEFAGSTGGSFSGCCTEMNGTYILGAPDEACTRVAILEGPYFGEAVGVVSTGSAQCATSQPDACYTSTFTDASGTYYTWYFIEDVTVGVTLSTTSSTGHEVQVSYSFRKVERTPTGCTASLIGPWIWSYATLSECVDNGAPKATTLSVSDFDLLITQCTDGDTVGPTVTVNLV